MKEYNFQWNALIFKFPRVINQELCMNKNLKLDFFSKGGGLKYVKSEEEFQYIALVIKI